MPDSITASRMRALEEAAISSGRVTGLELMERAGRGAVGAMFAEWPDLAGAPQRALVLCGPGNNGGDGFVVARLLRGAGWQVDLHLLGEPGKLPPDARTNHDRWAALGAVGRLGDDAIDGYVQRHPDTALAIDAIFGIGLTRPFVDFPRLRKALNTWRGASADGTAPRVVAIDVPSGMDADTGLYPGFESPMETCAMANLTVTFHAPKRGHLLNDGPLACGRLVVADIGL